MNYTEQLKQIRECIKAYFYNLCKDGEVELNIPVQGTFGLSELQQLKYLKVFKDEEDIRFVIGSIADSEPCVYSFNDMLIEELAYIIDYGNH